MTHGKWEVFSFVLLTCFPGESFILGMFESTYASCARLVIQLLYKIAPWKTNSLFSSWDDAKASLKRRSVRSLEKFASTIFYISNFAVQLPSSTYQQSLGIMDTIKAEQLLTPGSGWCACGRGDSQVKTGDFVEPRGYRDFFAGGI